jgi:hypothetical protein
MIRAVSHALAYAVAAAVLAPVALVVACTGGPAFGTDNFSASSSGSNGSSGTTSSGGTSGSDASTCSDTPQPGDRACVPPTAPIGKELTIDVADSVGCLPCQGTLEPCSVSVTGTAIALSMKVKTCTPQIETPCPAICALVSAKCTLPPLGVGTYTVTVAGESPRVGLPARELVVAGTGGSTSCTLAQAHPAPIAATDYGQGCAADADCEIITTGDVCTPCNCGHGAIAKTAHETYAGDLRAKSSQCATPTSSPACAGCAAATAKCNLPAGTCAVAP